MHNTGRTPTGPRSTYGKDRLTCFAEGETHQHEDSRIERKQLVHQSTICGAKHLPC
jgi:hypothetical protein